MGLTSAFLVAEVIGGIITGSLALLSDAAHMFTDVAALAIALAAIRIARRPADARRTFGYYRFEILAAAFNALLLFGVALYILIEAYQRWREPQAIQSMPMLVIAAIGLIVNLIAMRLLTSGKDESLNIKGAYIEVWSDMLGSLGVIAAALIIRATGWGWVDSLVAVAIGLWVLPRTWQLLRESLNVLLEGVPENLSLQAIDTVLRATAGVRDVHDLHVWAITSGKNSLTAHLLLDAATHADTLTAGVRERLAREFNIHHTTLQCEFAPCTPGTDCGLEKPTKG